MNVVTRAGRATWLTLLLALLLAMAACGEGDDLAPVDVGEDAEVDAGADEADDESESSGTDAGDDAPDDLGDAEAPGHESEGGDEPLDFGEDTNVALIDCVDGDDIACEIAYDYLGDDNLRSVATACEGGDSFACDAFDRIVAVVGEGPVEGESGGEGYDPDPASGSTDLQGFVVVNALGIETTSGTLFFGEAPAVVVDAISAEIGAPTEDSGLQATGDGSGCGGSEYRFVSWGESLTITVLDESAHGSGFLHVSAWQHDGGEGVFAEASLGDGGTFDVRPGHTTVEELDANLGPDAVLVYDEPPIGPTYEITDALGTMLGELTGTSSEDIVQTVFSGSGCGE